jgi:hypothetical protein
MAREEGISRGGHHGGGRGAKTVLLFLGGIAVIAALYFGFQSLRVGHAYDGTPEEIVEAMLHDIRADIESESWGDLGGYGVATFLSWRNETELRNYVEGELGDEEIGPVDYVRWGVPSDVTSIEGEIHFTLLEPRSGTTCRVVLKKRLGSWFVKDIGSLGGTGS